MSYLCRTYKPFSLPSFSSFASSWHSLTLTHSTEGRRAKRESVHCSTTLVFEGSGRVTSTAHRWLGRHLHTLPWLSVRLLRTSRLNRSVSTCHNTCKEFLCTIKFVYHYYKTVGMRVGIFGQLFMFYLSR